jgi:hypothetical protein
MWDYNRINKQRDAYCAREGIDASQRAEFRDLGSESPLFRYVVMLNPRRSAQLSINSGIRFKDQDSRIGSVDTERDLSYVPIFFTTCKLSSICSEVIFTTFRVVQGLKQVTMLGKQSNLFILVVLYFLIAIHNLLSRGSFRSRLFG